MKTIASIRFAAPLLVVAAVALPACQQKGDDDGTGGSDTTATSSSQGSGGDAATGGQGSGGGDGGSGTTDASSTTSSTGAGGSGDPGWTIIPLIDDESTPDFGTQVRVGVDLVAGIHFVSLDEGYLATNATQNGGAIFKATQNAVTEVALGGRIPVPCSEAGFVGYQGIEKSASGYYALSTACVNVSSRDDGATFDIELNSDGQLGLERLFALRSHGDEVIAVSNDYIAASAEGPAPSTIWDYIWAPEASPTIPNPVPADQCQHAPSFGSLGLTSSVHIGADGTHIVYGSVEGDLGETALCVSRDAGRSFFPKTIGAIHPDAQGLPPTGTIFTSEDNGVAWYGSSVVAGRQWIAHTEDGGDTWNAVSLPDSMAESTIELHNGFFAPDGQHGWLLAYNKDERLNVILKTTDGGATWALSGGDLAAKVSEAAGERLISGFALDANHIWVGGEYGIFASNSAGGD